MKSKCSSLDFYSFGQGDRLIDPSRYPEEIVRYLEDEKLLIASFSDQFDLLVEVGCMSGRYLEWAVQNDKRYLGIDVVRRYVDEGKKRILSSPFGSEKHRIEICDAAMMHRSMFQNGWISAEDKILLIFPFNSFGNMSDHKAVISSLAAMKRPFLMCSYAIDKRANLVRLKYYKNCSYKKVQFEESERGVQFFSDDGLCTTAYSPLYLEALCAQENIPISRIPFSIIGIAYKG